MPGTGTLTLCAIAGLLAATSVQFDLLLALGLASHEKYWL